MSWKEVSLGNHVDLISGPAFKSQFFTEDSNDIPLIKGDNIGQGFVIWDKSRYWPRKDLDDYKRFLLREGDVILAMDRPWVTAGLKFALINRGDPESLLVQRVARLQGRNGLLTSFLRYIIASPEFSGYIKNIMGGTNVPHISANQIKAYRIRLPSVKEQQRIADILSAYDDLIENNRRRIALLEQAARLLYKEWFVRLRFPGHEHVKITDGIPDGWGRERLDEVAKVNRASLRIGYQGEIEYIDISSVTRGFINETAIYRFKDAPSRARRIVQHGDIIWSCVRPNRKSYALIWRPAENLIASTGFAVITPTKVSTSYLYQALTTEEFVGYLTNNARGVAYPAVTASDFAKSVLVVPPNHLLHQFDEIVEPTLTQKEILSEENRRLTKARDLLLPRLMNGELAV